MLKIADFGQLGRGFVDKSIGIMFEASGALLGNDRLKNAGRARQEAGTERLAAVEEETKATSRAAEAKVQEQRQKQHQPVDKRSAGDALDDQDSAITGTVEKVKGAVKEGWGKVTGNEEMEAEGDAQQDKAEAQTQAARHNAKAAAHRQKAEGALKASEARR